MASEREKGIREALRVAKKRMKFRRAKDLEGMLHLACGSFAEAYRLGSEETQSEIVRRIITLPTPEAPHAAD